MTVEGQRYSFMFEDGATDRFPVGMRVLAVDDDPLRLKVLETMLRKCQYQVTATNKAIKALKMLRVNRNRYDIVITEVNMPEMDGFKFLELVRLEMDLPVIMLSANSDTKLVMKGITLGACDYLLKPVRIERLKNIWQHVIRKRMCDSKDQNKSPDLDKACHGTESANSVAISGNSGENDKLSMKQKHRNEEEKEYGKDDETEKKPCVVWSVELHRKFVAAVNQLGLETAVPMKIIALMNVKGLTSENVASHLQQYRSYLKRLNNMQAQYCGKAAPLGVKDSTYLQMGSIDGSLSVANTALSSYSPGGMLGRLNSPVGLNLPGITPSGLAEPVDPQNLSNSSNSLGKLQGSVLASQFKNLFIQIPTSLEHNELQQDKCTAHIGGFNSINNTTGLTLLPSFPDTRVIMGSSSNSLSGASGNPLMFQWNPQPTHSILALMNLGLASSNPKSIELGNRVLSNFPDHNRCSESLQGAGQLSKFPSNAVSMSGSYNHDHSHSSNLGISSTCHQIGNNPQGFSSVSVPFSLLAEPRGDVQCREGLIGNIVQPINYIRKQRWEEHEQDYRHYMNWTFGAINSSVSADRNLNPLSQNLDKSDAVCSKNKDQSNGITPSALHSIVVEKSAMETKMKPSFDQTKLQGGQMKNRYGSLDDIMSSITKRQRC
ncbi:two-component response regulator ARR18 isoform X2 [Ziziphus jujuba]|uniref:Two-component response regulator n=1 Tax=Ziziphus jujuba TaxID=326968 RepID=A0A6P4AEF4_ZIZJJ|nr:two-component response regulator ARR18 isoform X2 [Ziziphus jujuba]